MVSSRASAAPRAAADYARGAGLPCGTRRDGCAANGLTSRIAARNARGLAPSRLRHGGCGVRLLPIGSQYSPHGDTRQHGAGCQLVKILLSNDDGYRAEGLAALGQAIKPLGAVTIVAPDRNRSGASNSLTLDVPVRAVRYDTDAYYVNGTPTDCVHLAISGLFDFEHDIVVTGVNDGANLGDDTLYSGTVAAAVEGRFLGLPAVAVSLVPDAG